NGTIERRVPFAKSCCTYYDPKRLSNLTDQFLLLKFRFGQNPRYFEDYIVDVRGILKFSEEVKRNGSQLLFSLKNYSESMCIHVRMGDFVIRRISTDMNITVEAANKIAKKMVCSSHFMIFGDDKKFMTNMSRNIVNSGGWKDDLLAISKYKDYLDLFLASQLCSSFLITAATSTFGWWLAFFVQNQNAVYYLNDTRRHADKVP
ncbi:unnamed protein product, partial [Cylicocyclus nassatus]